MKPFLGIIAFMLDSKTSMKGKVVLAVCAHPDDMEFGASGTIAKWVKEGATAYYIILTDGTKGSEDMGITTEQLKEIRHSEQENAAKVLGVKRVFLLDYVDGELQNTPEVRRWVVRIIRQVKADVVICQDPSFMYDADRGYINHPDHRTAGQIAMEAVFPFARNSRTFPELLGEGLEPHKVSDVLITTFGKANFFVDISDSIEQKLDALACHKSQQEDPAATRVFVTEWAKRAGENHGFKFAEGFTKISIER